jgi:hypothetical protein
MTKPKKIIFTFLESFKTKAETIIKIKAKNIKQNVPWSRIIPNKEILKAGENIVEARKARTIPKPETMSQDFGKTIFPSDKRAAAQKTIETTKPTTRSSPLEVSTGIFVKGKKNNGNNTTTRKSAQNEILSKVFDNI